jgi:hypothetical protein
MNRSAKRQKHDQARKQHKHQMQQSARAAAKAPRSAFPRWLLIGVVAVVVLFVVGATFGR